MYHLAEVFPLLNRFNLPFTRDQVMLFMVAVNEVFLGLDHYLAHLVSGTIRPLEMLPIIFGVFAGLLVLILLAWLESRGVVSVIVTVVMSFGIAIGILGWWLHFIRTILPSAPPGNRFTLELFVWAPPILGPLTASLVGLLGVGSAWEEKPVDSGCFQLLGGRTFSLPISKARAYFFLVGLGTLATLISSVLDHARTGFSNLWLWIPVAVGIFGVVVSVVVGMMEKPSRADLVVFFLAMLLLIATGVAGAFLHVYTDWVAAGRVLTLERLVRGAPFLAPLLFTDMGTLGIVVMLAPEREKVRRKGLEGLFLRE